MTKREEKTATHVVIFVEGDTDELFFKALVEHYRQRNQAATLPPCSVCNLKGVTRSKLKNEYLPDARKNNYHIQTVCCSYDTDVFEVKNPLIVDWESLGKKVKRLDMEHIVQIGVKKFNRRLDS